MMPTSYAWGWWKYWRHTGGLDPDFCAAKLWWTITAGDPTIPGVTQLYVDMWLYLIDIFRPVTTDDRTAEIHEFTVHYGGVDYTSSSFLGTSGLVHHPALAPQYCAYFRKITATPGRNGVGRLYLPGIPKIWITGGLINSAGIAAYQPFATAMVQPVTLHGVTFQPGLHSLQDNDIKPIVNFELVRAPKILQRRSNFRRHDHP